MNNFMYDRIYFPCKSLMHVVCMYRMYFWMYKGLYVPYRFCNACLHVFTSLFACTTDCTFLACFVVHVCMLFACRIACIISCIMEYTLLNQVNACAERVCLLSRSKK